MMTLPTFQEIWTLYLFNTKLGEQPKEDGLLSESIIRRPDQTGSIKISAVDFMKKGQPGGFINGALSSVVRNFFEPTSTLSKQQKNILPKIKALEDSYLRHSGKGVTAADGSVSFGLKEILLLNEQNLNIHNPEPNKYNSFSQTQFRLNGESNYDFAQRVQLFQTTGFQIGAAEGEAYDEEVQFVLHADGKREIKNFVITPAVEDNFDFVGGNENPFQRLGNKINEFISDPSAVPGTKIDTNFGLGRTVNFVYTDWEKVERVASYTVESYHTDVEELISNNYLLNGLMEKTRLLSVLDGSKQIYRELYKDGIISFKDSQRRSVYYGTNGADRLDLDKYPVEGHVLEAILETAKLMPSPIIAAVADIIDDIKGFNLPSRESESLSKIEKIRLQNFQKINEPTQVTFVAGDGDDVIQGLDMADGILLPNSPENNDRIFGGKGHDKLYGRRGDDELDGGDGDDLLDGGVDNDHLDGGVGLDTYYIEEHDVVKDSDGSGKIIFKGTLPLTEITASRFVRADDDPADTWFSVDANGKRDAELVATRVGDDLMIARSGSDSVQVKSFFTLAQGSATGHRVDALGLSLEDEQPKNADGTGLIQQAGHADRYNVFYLGSEGFEIAGGAKDDVVFGSGAKASIIRTSNGNDRVFGGFHADVIEGGEGNDVLNGSAYVGAGTNRSLEEQALDADTLVGGVGSDLISGMAGDDTIHTGERGEHLAQAESGERGDWANGGLGKDKVYGSRGHDLLMGGEDTDWLYGGASDDVLVGDGFIRAASRSNFIYVEGTIGGGTYVPGTPSHPLVPPGMGGGYTPPTISRPALTNEYAHRDGKWNLQVLNSASPTHKDTFEWNVSIDRDAGDYSLNAKLQPLNNDHRLADGGAADYLFGGAGNDLIMGQDGNDYLQGEEGDDILWGDDSRNLELEGNDYLDGGKGNDQLRGGKGNDVLVAGLGDDKLYGGEGEDAYLFTTAHLQNGEENIIQDSDNKGYIAIDGFALDQLNWAADKAQPNQWHNQLRELVLEQKGSDLIITGKQFAATLKVQGYQKGALGLTLPTADAGDSANTGSGETSPPQNDATALAVVYGSEQSDTLTGTAADEVLNGLTGDDLIYAGAGTDQVFGDVGHDTLHGDAGDDKLYGGLDDDTLYGGDGSDLLNGEDGTDLLHGGTGDDALFAWTGNDTLHGDAGDDKLYGGLGDDTLYGGEGNDLLDGEAGTDVLYGGAGDDNLFGWSGNDTLYGGEDHDSLYGWEGKDQLHGDAGNDLLAGGQGNDTLAGGLGNDQLFGDTGSDLYVFLGNEGHDLIVEDTGDTGAIDIVQLQELSSTDAYSLSRVGDDLHLSYGQQRIVVRDQFAQNASAIEEFHFGDGVILHAQELNQRMQASHTETLGSTTALTQAMASFGATPVAGQSNLLAEQPRAIQPVLATAI